MFGKGGMSNIMKQAKEMQAKMAKAQEEVKLLEEKLIIKGGGHAQAAGITLKGHQIQMAMERLSEILRNQQQISEESPRLNLIC